jgi:membrane-bound lytic murein transglycosylase A
LKPEAEIMQKKIFVLSAMSVIAACAPLQKIPDQLTLQPVSFATLPGWQQDNVAAAIVPLQKSCAVIAKHKPDRALMVADKVMVTSGDFQAVCSKLKNAKLSDVTAARGFFEQNFTPYRAGNRGNSDGLFTGYYEPSLRGSLHRHGKYQTPLYARPTDLVQVNLGDFSEELKGKRIAGRVEGTALKPYPDRAAITQHGLKQKAKVLLWVDDPVDAFFLEVQGSGRVTLDNGKIIHVGYAAQNGRTYVAIGKAMRERGLFASDEKITMQKIRAWLAANPDQARAIMNLNPSYVFFQNNKAGGPLGAQNVPLTPLRSIAVDPAFVAYGTPLWLDVMHPTQTDQRIQTLLVGQDTGGAIKGPVRGDLFWGYGADAETNAGVMQSRGVYYLLLPAHHAP